MEYIPVDLDKLWKSDLENNIDLFLKINDVIEENGNDTFYSCDKYSDIVYKLEWPGEDEKRAISEAKRDAEKVKPLLVRGVVVGNEIVEGSNIRRLQIVDENRFGSSGTTDTEQLHYLKDTGYVHYTLFAYRFREHFDYTIGPLEEIRPGTKVILSLVDLGLAPNNHRNLTAYFTDVMEDDKPQLIYVDNNFKLHKTKDYLTLYESLRKEELSKSTASPGSSSSGGCYIATAVYGSYDCPEVWTLRRYRDDVLAQTNLGRLFIKAYYTVSPTLVKWFGNTGWFHRFWKTWLDKKVAELQCRGIDNSAYSDKNW